MSSKKEFINEILERFSPFVPISVRPMMGGSLFYCDDVLLGSICGDCLFLKQTPTSFCLLPNAELGYPYAESKTLMLMAESFEDEELYVKVFRGMTADLQAAEQNKKSGEKVNQLFLREVPRLEELHHEYEKLTKVLIQKKQRISCMESCTSGLIASFLTDTEGASAIFRGSFVTYSNEAKLSAGVPAEIIQKYGVYSAETALAMAAVCKARMETDLGVGVTGSLGRADPENADSAPGEVFIAIDLPRKKRVAHVFLSPAGSRFEAKLQTAQALIKILKKETMYFA